MNAFSDIQKLINALECLDHLKLVKESNAIDKYFVRFPSGEFIIPEKVVKEFLNDLEEILAPFRQKWKIKFKDMIIEILQE